MPADMEPVAASRPVPPLAHYAGTLRARTGRAKRLLQRKRNALDRALREEPTGEHLVRDPVFILSPVRSGSTLLRAILNTHTEICAPHELHLAQLQITSTRTYATDSWSTLGMTLLDLENMLWDRALHRLLVRSGKRLIVDKTPQNSAIWPRIHEFWPDARYIHLRRHPGSIVRSIGQATPTNSAATNITAVLNYGRWLNAAREALPGPTVTYEDLIADPEATIRTVCGDLGVRFQPRMLRYKKIRARSGLGDWSDNIKSGRIQPLGALPTLAETPRELHELTRSWGYDTR